MWRPSLPVLAFDLGTACGWALVEADRVSRSGALDLRPDGHPGSRYLKLIRWLERTAWPERITVALEDVQNHSRLDTVSGKKYFAVHAAHIYGGFRAVVECWAAAIGAEVLPVGVGSWKAAIGARGGPHAAKAEVMRAIRVLGYAPSTQDEADAIGIGLHAFRQARRPARIA